jgi:hypothetical protein
MVALNASGEIRSRPVKKFSSDRDGGEPSCQDLNRAVENGWRLNPLITIQKIVTG